MTFCGNAATIASTDYLAVRAEAARAKFPELTTLPAELDRVAEHLTVTRTLLRELPDPQPPPEPTGYYRPTRTTRRSRPCRPSGTSRCGREACEAMDLLILPKQPEGIRSKHRAVASSCRTVLQVGARLVFRSVRISSGATRRWCPAAG